MPKHRPLTDNEKKLFEAVNKDDVELCKSLVRAPDVAVDCYDETGMTPLQQAAFKASRRCCEVLISCGANVNTREHDHGYSTLMFAALSGDVSTVQYLLTAGADTEHTNTLNRTASQMAAFVGHHACVNLINSFLPRSEIDYFTTPRGLDTKAKLPAHLAAPIYEMILETNIHPVKHLMWLKKHHEMIDKTRTVSKVLELVCERQIKAKETNEIMSMKMHYLSFIMRHVCATVYGPDKKTSRNKDDDDADDDSPVLQPRDIDIKLDAIIKTLLRGSPAHDGAALCQEKFLRQMVREFPYHQSSLLQQLVHQLSRTDIGSEPSCVTILMQALHGQHAMQSDSARCETCGVLEATKLCAGCHQVSYCDGDCQKMHWFTHKKMCKILKTRADEMAARAATAQTAEEKYSNMSAAEMAQSDMDKLNSIKCPMEDFDFPGYESAAPGEWRRRRQEKEAAEAAARDSELSDEPPSVCPYKPPSEEDGKETCPAGNKSSPVKTCPFAAKSENVGCEGGESVADLRQVDVQLEQ